MAVETTKYMIPIKAEGKGEFIKNVRSLASKIGWEDRGAVSEDVLAEDLDLAAGAGGDGEHKQAAATSKDGGKAVPSFPDYLVFERNAPTTA